MFGGRIILPEQKSALRSRLHLSRKVADLVSEILDVGLLEMFFQVAPRTRYLIQEQRTVVLLIDVIRDVACFISGGFYERQKSFPKLIGFSDKVTRSSSALPFLGMHDGDRHASWSRHFCKRFELALSASSKVVCACYTVCAPSTTII